ncbi:MAG: DUF167 domain-containing protein [Candidatus Peribacteraceae bacterium]
MTLEDLHRSLASEGSVSFSVRARPGASRSRVVSVMDDGSVKIDVAAPAEEGKANAALRKFLAREFSVPISNVEIVAGGGGRRKVVRIQR